MKTILITLLLSLNVYAGKLTKVAVIDSGYSGMWGNDKTTSKLCKKGHYDFTLEQRVVGYDIMGHGSHVSNLIVEEAGSAKKYCLLHYKVFGGIIAEEWVVSKAIIKAIKAGADVINLSLEVRGFSKYDQKVMKWALRKGVIFFVAAGNSGVNLNEECKIYPQCFPGHENMNIVGSVNNHYERERYSNYGARVTIYDYGSLKNGARGTSFATPRALGKYLRAMEMNNVKN